MKKFLVFAAMFAAAFMMVSCGGADLNGDGVTYDGKKYCSEFWGEEQCKGHNVRVCAEGDKSWYEVEGTGKKFECNNEDDDSCIQAVYDLNNYCYDTNIDYDEEDGTICVTNTDQDNCEGKVVKYCQKDDSTWYEVDGKKFECDETGCVKAGIDLNNYCYGTDIDYEEEDGATCVTNSEPDTCGGKAVKYCTKEDGSYWYEVDGKKFECKETGSEECTQAMVDFSKYCAEAEENGEGNEGESEFTEKATAYFPNAYAEKTLAAWYSLTEKDENKIKIEAIFLFDDNTLVKTTSKVYSEADGRPAEDKTEAEGGFTITSGDYDNGEAHVVLAGGEMEFDVTISDGVLSAMGAEFIKQDNADLPEAR